MNKITEYMRDIRVVPSMYYIRLTSHSNNVTYKCLCYDCLAKSKTNKEYAHYQAEPMLSSSRVCAKCHAMTPQACMTVFGITRDELTAKIKRGGYTLFSGFSSAVRLYSSVIDLSIISKEVKNGKD